MAVVFGSFWLACRSRSRLLVLLRRPSRKSRRRPPPRLVVDRAKLSRIVRNESDLCVPSRDEARRQMNPHEQRYRRSGRLLVFVFDLYLPVVGLAGYTLIRFFDAKWPAFVLAGLWMTVIVVVSVRRFVAYYRRKGKYTRTRGFVDKCNPLARCRTIIGLRSKHILSFAAFSLWSFSRVERSCNNFKTAQE
jgi:hypothetical protein